MLSLRIKNNFKTCLNQHSGQIDLKKNVFQTQYRYNKNFMGSSTSLRFMGRELIYIQLKKKHKSMADEQFKINSSFTKSAINETGPKKQQQKQ